MNWSGSGSRPCRAFTTTSVSSVSQGELEGTVRVQRGGVTLVADGSGRAVLWLEPDRAADAGVMHGDRVLVRRARRRGRAGISARPAPDLPPGVVVRILERANSSIVGTLQSAGRELWVVPGDPRLGPRVPVLGGPLGASDGEKVVLAVTRFPGPAQDVPVGRIVERLGPAGDPGAETLAIIRNHDLRDEFPPEALAEADRLPREVTPAERSEPRRVDLTGRLIFTIDDAEARDLDDAVSIDNKADGSWRLGVHIADVSHYVASGSPLDAEAALRGTSVYLVDRVLPMFPQLLSNGLASLHPGTDRLTVSVFMDIDRHGRVTGSEVTRSVIRSAARLTYSAVAALLRPEFGDQLGSERDVRETGPDDGAALESEPIPEDLSQPLAEMARLARCLRRRRMARGSLDFDFPEEKVELDGAGRPRAVVHRPRNTATQLIEEFMIVANEAVADFLLWNGTAFIARVHEEPFPADLLALRELLAPLGFRVPTSRTPRPSELQAILEASRGRPEQRDVHRALLRALPQARYSAVRRPHFALASANYCHFTSPIRRYPDLTVHRQVAAVLDGSAHPDPTEAAALVDRLELVAQACSRTERAAEAAERESVALKKTELAQRCLGDVAEGEVVAVFEFGAFVRLPNGVEGLVPARDEIGLPAGGARLRLGNRVRVQVARADVSRRRVDLSLA